MRSLSNHFLKRPYLHIENIKLDKFGQVLGFEKLVRVRGVHKGFIGNEWVNI